MLLGRRLDIAGKGAGNGERADKDHACRNFEISIVGGQGDNLSIRDGPWVHPLYLYVSSIGRFEQFGLPWAKKIQPAWEFDFNGA